jgi:hypothetical protein
MVVSADALPHFPLNTGLRVRHILRKLCPRLLVDAGLRALRHSSKPRQSSEAASNSPAVTREIMLRDMIRLRSD